MSGRRKAPIEVAAERIRAFALALPGAWEDHPWGESVAKVGKKVFAFLGMPEEGGSLSLSVKLPESAEEALSMPFAEPTGYGLGRAGWVSHGSHRATSHRSTSCATGSRRATGPSPRRSWWPSWTSRARRRACPDSAPSAAGGYR